eukprot:3145715-Amphidinium_carterae.1
MPIPVLVGVGEDTLTEVLLVSLIWGERSMPQQQIEEVIVCVPAAASDESSPLITLNLWGATGDIIGDCTASFMRASRQ